MKLNSKNLKISALSMVALIIGMILVTPVLACPAGTPCSGSIIQPNTSVNSSVDTTKLDLNMDILNGNERTRVLNNLLANDRSNQVDQYINKNGFSENINEAIVYSGSSATNSSKITYQFANIPVNTGKKNLDSYKMLLSSGKINSCYIRANGTSNYFPSVMNTLEKSDSYKNLKDNLTKNGYNITASSVIEVVGQTVDSSTNNSNYGDFAVVRLTVTNSTKSESMVAGIDINNNKVVIVSSSEDSCALCIACASICCGIPLGILTVAGCLAACSETYEAAAPYCMQVVGAVVSGFCSYGGYKLCKHLNYCS